MRILYVDVDSLRPDRLGCYGYGRPTSPNIDAVAREGVVFTNYFCSDSPCVPSRAGTFSGRPGIRNGVVAHEDTPSGNALRYANHEHEGSRPVYGAGLERYRPAPTLAHLLAHSGVNTVSFSSFADRHLAGWFHFGFRRFDLASPKGGDEDAGEINAMFLPWLRRHATEDRWFAHLNYWDPHTLYAEPLEYAERMAEYPAPAWPDEEVIQEQQDLVGVRTPRTLWAAFENGGKSPVPTMPHRIARRGDFEHLANGYDGAIRYLDEHLGRVFDEIEAQGVLDETAVIISADHGEAFGELGQYMDHGSASPAVHRVPLIVRWPGVTDGADGSRRGELLYNLDLTPTVAEALGLEVPEGWCGRSFLPLLSGRRAAQPRGGLVLAHGLHTRQRAVLDGRYLYVRTYHPGLFPYPPQMLFDLVDDPHQTNDLAQREPSRVASMDEDLRVWEAENVAATGLTDPMRDIQGQPPSTFATLEEYAGRLRDQGRKDDAEELVARWKRINREYAPAPLP
jgi:arylsulfatase A-like enzyme